MISIEQAWNPPPPVDVGAVMEAFTLGELTVLAEEICPMLGGMQSPGMRALASALFEGAQRELLMREIAKAKERAAFEMIAAELRPAPTDPTGDVSGIPPWSTVSPPDVP